jgi:hypothetical protein
MDCAILEKAAVFETAEPLNVYLSSKLHIQKHPITLPLKPFMKI